MSKALLVAPVNEVATALSLYAVLPAAVPARLIDRVEKVATPPTAATPSVPLSTAPAAPVVGVIDTVMVLVSLVTTFPPASSTATRMAPIT